MKYRSMRCPYTHSIRLLEVLKFDPLDLFINVELSQNGKVSRNAHHPKGNCGSLSIIEQFHGITNASLTVPCHTALDIFFTDRHADRL